MSETAEERERIKAIRDLCTRMQRDMPYGGLVYPKDANVRVSDIRAILRGTP